MRGVIDLRYFGSVVRADADKASDVDVLCVVHSKEDADLSGLEKKLDQELVRGRDVDLSVYGADRIQQMYREGHLFAWHLYRESVPVARGYDFIVSLGEPGEYKKSVEDIQNLLLVLNDVKEALTAGTQSLVFEAGLLYVVCRNVGISASWHSENGLDFSRYAPFNIKLNGKTKDIFIGKEIYDKLCLCRHASMRGASAPRIKLIDVVDACHAIERWALGLLKEIG